MQSAQGKKKQVTRRKSAALLPGEVTSLKKYIKGFNTLTEAAETIGVSRQVLFRVNLVKSGSPENIAIIRKAIA